VVQVGVIRDGGQVGVIRDGVQFGVIRDGGQFGVIRDGVQFGVIRDWGQFGVIRDWGQFGVIRDWVQFGVIRDGGRKRSRLYGTLGAGAGRQVRRNCPLMVERERSTGRDALCASGGWGKRHTEAERLVSVERECRVCGDRGAEGVAHGRKQGQH